MADPRDRLSELLAYKEGAVHSQDGMLNQIRDRIEYERAGRGVAWRPLPHQISPKGDWYGWLLLAGRGAGKTAACANFIVDHVNGPPCIPGPMPHHMAIVAPTIGDAATACFTGPSGIRTFSPDAIMRSQVGGQLITWPNGAQAKLYGAREPDDIERLRAGGNTCLVAGTLIRTARGQVPIECVRVGDQVWTRHGLRRVLRSAQTGVKPTLRIVTEQGRELTLTKDHAMWVNDHWSDAQFIKPGDTLAAWCPMLTMTEFAGTNERVVTTRTRNEDSSTVTSGKSITGQSHLSITSTIGLRMICTQSTLIDSSVSHRRSTPHENVIRTTTMQLQKQKRGARRGHDGRHARLAVLTVESRSKHVRCSRTYDVQAAMMDGTSEARYPVGHTSFVDVRSAAQCLSVNDGARLERVRPTVVDSLWRESDVHTDKHSRNGCGVCASFVALGFADPPTMLEVSLAPDRVLDVYALNVGLPVYDLLVEHDHEFFANDVLVGNCIVWMEELAAWRYLDDAWDQIRFGLRLGKSPRWIGSTTPKPRPLIKKLAKGHYPDVVLTHATMYDNPHLPDRIKEALEEAYHGTSVGSQELYGKIVEQDPDALWHREQIESNRLHNVPDDLRKIEVGVDPSGGSGEQGIVVVASNREIDDKGKTLNHGFVLDDRSGVYVPDQWGRIAVQTAIDWEADCIVVETNFGGDMAVATIMGAAEKLGVSIPVHTVRASRGKQPRAQPVAAMNAQERWHHVGRFESLEDQMCVWTPDSNQSPDRIDAMVWPAWHMKIVSTVLRAVGSFGGGMMANRTLVGRR